VAEKKWRILKQSHRFKIQIKIMGNQNNIMVPVGLMKSEFTRVLIKKGFSDVKAEKCSDIFTINSLEGVYSHGVNRFPRFVSNTRDGYIKPSAEPELISANSAVEQWTGNQGPGPLNAVFATDRVTELADKNGIGLLALANTNHWMRGGTYGWQAAKKGFVFIGWTNTTANMPAWGAKDPRLGNNPFVIAVPYQDEAIVLDFAMSQYSYGKMETYAREGKLLQFPAGFDKNGVMTNDPSAVLESWRAIPVGYWKGAGLSLLLDILATILSGGQSTHEISKVKTEYNVSQVFIAIKIEKLKNYNTIDNIIHLIIADYKNSVPEKDSAAIRYPGEYARQTREKSIKEGIPVDRNLWEYIRSL
jgi:3-dehydro-L-gulonate 2-dehydrogenase